MCKQGTYYINHGDRSPGQIISSTSIASAKAYDQNQLNHNLKQYQTLFYYYRDERLKVLHSSRMCVAKSQGYLRDFEYQQTGENDIYSQRYGEREQADGSKPTQEVLNTFFIQLEAAQAQQTHRPVLMMQLQLELNEFAANLAQFKDINARIGGTAMTASFRSYTTQQRYICLRRFRGKSRVFLEVYDVPELLAITSTKE